MGAILSCGCWQHRYEKASIHFTVNEWGLQENGFVYVQHKFRAVGITNPHVHGLAYTHIRHFLKSTKEKDVYCEVTGDLKAGTDMFVLVC